MAQVAENCVLGMADLPLMFGSLPKAVALYLSDGRAGPAMLHWQAQSHEMLSEILAREGFVPGVELEPAIASRSLERIRRDLTLELEKVAQTFTFAEWLQIIRAIPLHFMEGPNAQATVANFLNTTVAVGLSRTAPVAASRPIPFGKPLADCVLYFLNLARRLKELQAFQWLAGAGCTIVVGPDLRLSPISNDDIDLATHRFDTRMRSLQTVTTRLGLHIEEDLTDVPHNTSIWLAGLIAWGDESSAAYIRSELLKHGVSDAQFVIKPIDLRPLIDLAASRRDVGLPTFDRVLSSLLLLLNSVPLMVQCHAHSWTRILQTGYLRFKQPAPLRSYCELLPMIADRLRAAIPGAEFPVSCEQMISVLNEVRPSLWPMTTPRPLACEDGSLIVDFYGASQCFLALLSVFETGGDGPRLRGPVFEAQVQSIIDRSPFRPPDDLRAMRGRPLALDSAMEGCAGDIDAVFVRDGVATIVECYSFTPGPGLTRRNYNSVVDQAYRSEDKIKQVLGLVEALRRGTGGRFPPLDRINEWKGVVCSQAPVLTWPGMLGFDDAAVGLPRHCTVSELRAWLGTC